MILAVLQARMSSSRLPGKVLMPLAGAPMLARQIERVQRAKRIDRLILATSVRADDDAVAGVADAMGIGCYRGALDDVLDRTCRAAAPYAPTHVVRLTGDCPLADWDVIDRTIGFALAGRYDYASNTLRPTWPDGLDVEVATFATLKFAAIEATSLCDREHVMPYITSRPDRFRLGSYEQDRDLSALRWTVDEPRDFDFVSRVYDLLYPDNPAFTTDDVLTLIAAQPALGRLNHDIVRNEGLLRARTDEQGEAGA